MLALFLGGPQDGVLLNLHASALYWDFPAKKPWHFNIPMESSLPDEILRNDVVRYKCAMRSLDGEEAIYTQCGEGISPLTRARTWIAQIDGEFTTGRKPQPVYTFPRKP